MEDTVVIDGVTYVKKSKPSNIRIVVLQRGWVMVGSWSQSGDMCKLTDTSVIRVWGTTKGLGELRSGPTPNTKLDAAGEVEFHILTVVYSMKVEDSAWRK